MRRDGDHPVHLLPAGGRLRGAAGRGRADLRPRAHRHVPAGRRERLRRRVGEGREVPRGLPPERGGDERVLLPRLGPEDALRPLRHLRGGVQAAARAEAAAAGVRLLPEVLPHLQQPRRPRGHQRHRARGLHRPRARARPRVREGLPRLARGARVPAPAAGAAQGRRSRRRGRRARRGKGRRPDGGPALRDRRGGDPGGLRAAGARAARARPREGARRRAARPRRGEGGRHARGGSRSGRATSPPGRRTRRARPSGRPSPRPSTRRGSPPRRRSASRAARASTSRRSSARRRRRASGSR